MSSILLVLFGYFIGMLPFTVTLAVASGVDVWTESDLHSALRRQAGWLRSGAAVVVDTSKGLFPVLIGFGFSLSPWVVSLAALTTIAGQMWPLVVRRGEKGNTTAVGALVALALVYEVYLVLLALAFFAGGLLLRLLLMASAPENRDPGSVLALSLPFMMLVGFAAAPVFSWLAGGHEATTVGLVLILCVIMLKRLTAGLRRDMDVGVRMDRVLLIRLLFDRPVAGSDFQ